VSNNEFATALEAAHDSFDATIALFRDVALAVGDALGYAYPQYADDAVIAFIEKLR